MNKKSQKKIVAKIIDDEGNVKVSFLGGVPTPDEFNVMYMALLEVYTVGLLKTNKPSDVFNYFNNTFGIFLQKIVNEDDHYKLSKEHKEFKKDVDTILHDETEEDKKETTDNRLAAYLLAKDILVNEVGLSDESANVILNKRLNLGEFTDVEKK